MFSTSFTDITGFGQGRGIGHRERNIQNFRDGLRQQVLPEPVGPISRMFDFASFDIGLAAVHVLNALVVVVHSDGQNFLARELDRSHSRRGMS